jgi:hypothetical protein
LRWQVSGDGVRAGDIPKKTANQNRLAVVALNGCSPSVGAIARDGAKTAVMPACLAQDSSSGVHVGEAQTLARFVALVSAAASDGIEAVAIAAAALVASRCDIIGALAVMGGPAGPWRRMIRVPGSEVNCIAHRKSLPHENSWLITSSHRQ